MIPDHSNDRFNGDRPACEAETIPNRTKPKNCPYFQASDTCPIQCFHNHRCWKEILCGLIPFRAHARATQGLPW